MNNNKIKQSVINAVKSLAFPLFSIIVSFFVAVFFVMWSKGYGIGDYFTALTDLIGTIISGSFGDTAKSLETMVFVTPLIFTGVANAIAFKCGLFNIGVEGQFTMGLIAAAIVGLIPGLSPWVHVPLILLSGIIGGGIWGAIPGYLRAKYGTSEVINTIMMNYIALNVVNIIVLRTPIGVASKSATPIIQQSAQLLRFTGSSRANIGLIFALICAVFIYWLLWKTTIGYEIRAVGLNPLGAEYGGINVAKNAVLAMVLSGAIAGIGGACHLAGVMYNATDLMANIGYGFDGMAVALLAKSNPIGCIPAAILFGALNSSSRILQLNSIPKEIVYLIQSIVIIFVATDYIVKYLENRKRRKGVIANG
ncbi:sugar ABC transporter permease [Clostridium carboxidivorans P7]|nr:ABC transporter permease [Clostridium carboxidivorans]AKN32757.1 sugar ABC transporter permease [Clostridium carboxidivorans P7]EFG90004.1 amino acid or sugar ABC transport system, permease protein [Clostridium carboxidivorans P7]